MVSLLLVVAIGCVAFAWVRAAQRNRQRWLARLDLPGGWTWDEHEGSLEITGGLGEGEYLFREPTGRERGRWELEGHAFVTHSETGFINRYDLRFFDSGKIGLHGPGRERRVYTKIPSNVVPLRKDKRG